MASHSVSGELTTLWLLHLGGALTDAQFAAAKAAVLHPAAAVRSAPGGVQKGKGVMEDDFDDSTRCSRCGHVDMMANWCTKCRAQLCHGCLPYDKHGCEVWQQEQAERQRGHAPTTVPSFVGCEKPGCTERTYTRMECRFCRRTFCTEHRVEGTHVCPQWERHAAEQLKEKERKLREAAKKKKPSASAVPCPDKLHVDDQLPLSILLPPTLLSEGQRNPVNVIVDRRWGAGRAVQWLKEALGIEAAPHVAAGRDVSAARMRFVLVDPATMERLPSMLTTLKQLVWKGTVRRGHTLAMVPEPWYDALRGGGPPDIVDEALRSVEGDKDWARLVSAAAPGPARPPAAPPRPAALPSSRRGCCTQ